MKTLLTQLGATSRRFFDQLVAALRDGKPDFSVKFDSEPLRSSNLRCFKLMMLGMNFHPYFTSSVREFQENLTKHVF